MSTQDEELKRKHLQALKDLVNEGEEEETGDDEDEDEEDDIEEHLNAMFSGSELSEEVQTKIKTVFEAAVAVETKKKIAIAEADFELRLAKAIEENKQELDEEVDAYLTHVVEQWAEKNQIALKNKVKLDIFESFVGGLHNLFLEHNINMPEEKVELAEELMKKNAQLEADLLEAVKAKAKLVEEQESKLAETNKALEEAKQQLAFNELTEGLSLMEEVEKLKVLIEGKEFASTETFKKEVGILKESYFKKPSEKEEKEVLQEGSQETETKVSSDIASYAEMIAKQVRKNK